MKDSELRFRVLLALKYLNLLDSERELLENILDGTSMTKVIIIDDYGVVVATHYEFIQ